MTGEGQKSQKMEQWSYAANYRHHTLYHAIIPYAKSNAISFLDLDVRSRSMVSDVEVSAFSECFLIIFFS